MLINILSVEVKWIGPGSLQWSPVAGQRTVGVNWNIHRKFHLNMRKNFISLKMTEHWKKLPRFAVESPSLEMFKPAWMLSFVTYCRKPALAKELE